MWRTASAGERAPCAELDGPVDARGPPPLPAAPAPRSRIPRSGASIRAAHPLRVRRLPHGGAGAAVAPRGRPRPPSARRRLRAPPGRVKLGDERQPPLGALPEEVRDVRPHPGGEGPRSPAAAHAPDGHPVLTARFAVPAVPDVFVRRPRLVEPLAAGLHHPLTLVTGPAGAGKTLLLADWVGSLRPRTAAWLTVEQEDSAPGVFWAYVLHALRHHGIPPPPHIGSPADPGEVDRPLLARLADWLDHRDTPVVLVLDAFDRVAGCTEVAQELEFLLDHAGPALHLMITSRTEPLLPLHRHRAAGGLVDIRGADLAFRAEETAELTARHGLALSTGCADALTERTGGWAAGVRLCALAARQEEDPEGFLEHFEPGHSTVADFLLAEVLTAQPAETQDLLLRISILDETHPALADALTGRDDAAPILADLHRANAFVAPLGHDWYRVHPLFAEILRVHLRTRHPGLEPELHRAAARWLRGAGLPDQALPHTAAAGDWEQAAAELVGRPAIGRLLTGLDAARLADLFAGMPPDVSGPAADLVRAARELARHDVDRGLEHLRRAEEALPDDGTRAAAAVQLSGALLRVLAARLAGSADMAEAAAKAAADAREGLPAECLDDSPELSALLLTELGTAQLWAGRFDAARAALSAAAEAPEGPLTAMPRHEALARLALVDLLHGRPGPAGSRARRRSPGRSARVCRRRPARARPTWCCPPPPWTGLTSGPRARTSHGRPPRPPRPATPPRPSSWRCCVAACCSWRATSGPRAAPSTARRRRPRTSRRGWWTAWRRSGPPCTWPRVIRRPRPGCSRGAGRGTRRAWWSRPVPTSPRAGPTGHCASSTGSPAPGAWGRPPPPGSCWPAPRRSTRPGTPPARSAWSARPCRSPARTCCGGRSRKPGRGPGGSWRTGPSCCGRTTGSSAARGAERRPRLRASRPGPPPRNS